MGIQKATEDVIHQMMKQTKKKEMWEQKMASNIGKKQSATYIPAMQ